VQCYGYLRGQSEQSPGDKGLGGEAIVQVHGSTKVVILTTLLACGLGACDLFPESPSGERNFYGGYHPKSYDTTLRAGAAYRTAERRLITRATGFVPLCENDIDWISPRTVISQITSKNVILHPASDPEAAKTNLVNIQLGVSASAIETVQYHFTGVSKIFLQDGELTRVRDNLGGSCLALIRQRFDEGHSVFLVKKFIRASQVQITIKLKRQAVQGGFDVSRLNVRGLKMQVVDDATVVLSGAGIDIEFFQDLLL
jgi:hypothetical protein